MGKGTGSTPTKRSAVHRELTSPKYRQRKVRPRKGRGSFTRKGRPERPERVDQ